MDRIIVQGYKRRDRLKKLGQLIAISLIAIIFIPAGITILLGNNNQLDTYIPVTQKEQEDNEKQRILEAQLIGIVAKTIPISYEKEALKAQAMIARSQIILAQQEGGNKGPVSYMSIEEMKQLWGNDFNRNYSKIKYAVEETNSMVITYDGEPVQLVYHLQNAGQTQSSLDIWDIEVPYLKNVESPEDEKALDLASQKKYSTQELIQKINQHYNAVILESYNLETQIQIIERTQGGYVKSIQVGNQLMKGDDFRKILNLKSSCFTFQYSADEIIVVTKGMGHGVGLSQYGANEMAKRGKTYDQILQYYFPGISITDK